MFDENISTNTLTSIPDFLRFKNEILLLQREYGIVTPENDPDRFCSIVQNLEIGVIPHVTIFYKDSIPQGVIMGRIARRSYSCQLGYLRMKGPKLKYLDIIYGGIVVDNNKQLLEKVVSYFQDLLKNGDVDCISFNHLSANHPLNPWLQENGIQGKCEDHWRYTLPNSFELLMKSFSKKHRYNIKRQNRTLVEHFNDDVTLRVFNQSDQLEEFIKGTAQVASKTYQAGLGAAFSNSFLWRSILATEAEKGYFRGYWLQCQGMPIAFQVGAVYQNIYFLEFMGYLNEYEMLSPGAVLHVRVLEDLCKSDFRTVDYGFGEAEYKRIYGSSSWIEKNYIIFGRGLYLTIFRLCEKISVSLDSFIKRNLNKVGLLSPVKKMWRLQLRERK